MFPVYILLKEAVIIKDKYQRIGDNTNLKNKKLTVPAFFCQTTVSRRLIQSIYHHYFGVMFIDVKSKRPILEQIQFILFI